MNRRGAFRLGGGRPGPTLSAMQFTFFTGLTGGLILTRWLAELWLSRLSRKHVLAYADAMPEAFRGLMDQATYARSVQYTLAKGRLTEFDDAYSAAVLLLVLFSGALPWAFEAFRAQLGDSAWAMAAF